MNIKLKPKKEILVFVDWFWPGYLAGGPVQSIVSLVGYLHEDFDFKIVTTNKDLNSKEPYPGIEADKWIKLELGCEAYYASNLSVAIITKLIKETKFDVVYINSFFSKFFSIIPLQTLRREKIKKPVILAPRGMLGEGALALKKWKKKIFILYSKLTSLHSNVIWHATSAQEAMEIRSVFKNPGKVSKISNLPKKLKGASNKSKVAGKLNLCFISRISEKKNLLYALRVLSRIRTGHIYFNIFGPLESTEYWNKCVEEIDKLPANIQVEYKGSVKPNELEETLSTQHFMLLPTMNENFGHSIVESLMCYCPVIISDQTPWKDLEENNAGFSISLGEPDLFVKAAERALGMDNKEYSKWSLAANKYISSRINLNEIIGQYKNLFNDPI
ncbi:MAG: glycosyltransferase [Bacteroidia bacterium]|nr:glycosyltransferase [Bacteroidia bacterium]